MQTLESVTAEIGKMILVIGGSMTRDAESKIKHNVSKLFIHILLSKCNYIKNENKKKLKLSLFRVNTFNMQE